MVNEKFMRQITSKCPKDYAKKHRIRSIGIIIFGMLPFEVYKCVKCDKIAYETLYQIDDGETK